MITRITQLEKIIYILGKGYSNKIISSDEFVQQIVFELLKEYYHINSKSMTLRKYVKDRGHNGSSFDSEYEKMKRNVKSARKEQQKIFSSLGIAYDDRKMVEIEDRLKGYDLNESKLLQMENYTELAIVKSLSEKRLGNSHKVSRSKFEKIFIDYDDYVKTLKEDFNLGYCFAAIDFYDLQIRMNIELFYYLATIMEENNLKSISSDSIRWVSFGIQNEYMALQNRFLLCKNRWAACILTNSQYEAFYSCLLQTMMAKKLIIDALKKENIFMLIDFEAEDIKTYIEAKYNPFSIYCENKCWTNSRIDLARKVVKAVWL